MYSLGRFLAAQETMHEIALAQIRSGKKRSHWMWYIFPQLRGLGSSPMAYTYGIEDLAEAREYLAHPVLSARLLEISAALLALETNDAVAVFGEVDAMKLKSSMTLVLASGDDSVFHKVPDKYYDGEQDAVTLRMLG